jgi:hypothetical protein
MILDQVDRDVAVSDLLKKVSEVYTFITEDNALANIPSMLAVYGKIARQTLECTDFIIHYSEKKGACELNQLHCRSRLSVVPLHRGKTRQARLQRDASHDSKLQ